MKEKKSLWPALGEIIAILFFVIGAIAILVGIFRIGAYPGIAITIIASGLGTLLLSAILGNLVDINKKIKSDL